MRAVSVTELRKRIGYYLKSVEDNMDKIIILGTKGRSGVVIMSMGEYNSIEETNYLLRPEANRKALQESMDKAEAGDVVSVSIDDLGDGDIVHEESTGGV